MTPACFLRGLLILVALAAVCSGQNSGNPALPERVLLWPDGAPGALGNEDADKPAITVYPIAGPQKTRTGVVVFPGGGYHNLAMDHEGVQIAAWLNSYGITAFVTQYRLGPRYHNPVELNDGLRAVQWAREHAEQYGIDPHHIGVWGFSAGGHMASSVGTHFDGPNTRPDFLILAYPVITLRDPFAHVGSRENLVGKTPPPDLVDSLSNELHVTKDTPPTFLFHTSDDNVVPVQNSIEFYLALRKAGVRAEMHIFQSGPHGVGLARDHPELAGWPDLLAAWLKANGWR
jgi:acetyl esterase/lipase